MSNGGTMITGAGIPYVQLLVVRSAVKLEATGMKASRGINATRDWARHLGLKGTANKVRPALLVKLEELIEQARAAVQPGDIRAV